MAALKHALHEEFAQALARNERGSEVYHRQHPKVSKKTAGEKASRLAKDSKVAARIAEIRAKADKKLEEAVDRQIKKKAGETADTVARILGNALTQAEILAFATNVVLAKPSDLNGGESMLVESIKPGKYGDTLEVCDKLRALELSAKLQGFLIDRQDHTTGGEALPAIQFVMPESFVRRRGK